MKKIIRRWGLNIFFTIVLSIAFTFAFWQITVLSFIIVGIYVIAIDKISTMNGIQNKHPIIHLTTFFLLAILETVIACSVTGNWP